MSDYDVIVIGSGAGGGTLAHRLAPSGQAHPAARARRLAAARARELVARAPSSSTTATCRRTRGTTATASRSSRRCTTSSAARRSSTAPRSTASARRTSASWHTTTASRPRGRSATTRWSRTTPQAEQMLPRARRARRGPDRAAGERAVSVPGARRTSHGSSSSRTTSRRPASSPSTRRAASCSTSANPPFSACVRCSTCDGFPCLVHAKSDAEVLGVRPALEHPNVTLVTGARGRPARDRRGGHDGHRAWWSERDGGTRDVPRRPRGRLVRRGQLGRSCCSRRPTTRHPDGLANGSDQVGRNYMFHNSQAVLALSKDENPTVFQKTLGLNDFYFGGAGRRLPAGQHPDGRQVDGADVPRREAARDQARADMVARRSRASRRRLLALDRGPAAAGQPRHAAAGREHRARVHGHATTCRRSSSTTQLQVDARPPRHAPPTT